MSTRDEIEEIELEAAKQGKTPQVLLEEKLRTIRESAANAIGEPLALITRGYEPCSSGTRIQMYAQREDLFIGLIGEKLDFYHSDELSMGMLVSGVEKPHSLDVNTAWDQDFRPIEGGKFGGLFTSTLPYTFWYFMDRPLSVPDDSMEFGCFGAQSSSVPMINPRGELYIGRVACVGFLERKLPGWRYQQVADVLEYDLPITNFLGDKIEKEQLGIVRMIREEEGMRGVDFNENNVKRAIKEAVRRGYLNKGQVITTQDDEGIETTTNVSKFIAHKKAKYGL